MKHPLSNQANMTRLLTLEEQLVNSNFGLATIQNVVEVYTVR